jgi:ParB-like chromosome segregation protein Spo0J
MTLTNEMRAHPMASIVPKISRPDFEMIKEDIRAKGQLQEIIMLQGEILDGRSRWGACLELGITPKVREHDGSDPLDFVISQNLCRRHLNESQRALVAARLADQKQGGSRTAAQICALSHAEAAEKLNVSPRMVDAASSLLNAVERGTALPELLEYVDAGQGRLNRVVKLLHRPKEEQRELLISPVRRSGRPQSKTERWQVRFDKVTLENDSFGFRFRAINLAKDAERAGQLTSDRRRQLVSSVRCAAYRLLNEAQSVEQLGRMPFSDSCGTCGAENMGPTPSRRNQSNFVVKMA